MPFVNLTYERFLTFLGCLQVKSSTLKFDESMGGIGLLSLYRIAMGALTMIVSVLVSTGAVISLLTSTINSSSIFSMILCDLKNFAFPLWCLHQPLQGAEDLFAGKVLFTKRDLLLWLTCFSGVGYKVQLPWLLTSMASKLLIPFFLDCF